ncbi:hypothetical protein BT96DRAFT_994249 [Gymnopus androsaceus JB14]|uniref:Uncharacterized protein n=1 Tax=Gymnopus androsaceus JB14 TaxID=1447944 RepID=A0A6A4HN10_9AGAR|nr:hypothetical protein BT96DRAFT_994249 [Gymnopus androsaceus JB14]
MKTLESTLAGLREEERALEEEKITCASILHPVRRVPADVWEYVFEFAVFEPEGRRLGWSATLGIENSSWKFKDVTPILRILPPSLENLELVPYPSQNMNYDPQCVDTIFKALHHYPAPDPLTILPLLQYVAILLPDVTANVFDVLESRRQKLTPGGVVPLKQVRLSKNCSNLSLDPRAIALRAGGLDLHFD